MVSPFLLKNKGNDQRRNWVPDKSSYNEFEVC